MQQHQQLEPSSQQGLLEDLLAPRTEAWATFPNYLGDFSINGVGTSGLCPSGWSRFDEGDDLMLTSSFSNSPSFLELISSSIQPTFQLCPYADETLYSPVPTCLDSFLPINGSTSYDQVKPECHEYGDKTHLVSIQEEYPSMVEEEEDADQDSKIPEKQQEIAASDDQIPAAFSMGSSGERKNKSKKVEGQPSKNLMAERRRRKRLNDRLSMLRSIVPKISKMDRTSILGDTIDYMKELLEKINNLKDQDMESEVDRLSLMGSFKELNMNEAQARNPPKFDVERRDNDTRIQICCSTKPGLLLSTVNTLEVLGLDIQQCVISCFNDFSLQASCSEAVEQRTMISSEDMKQILFRNAGYGGRCL